MTDQQKATQEDQRVPFDLSDDVSDDGPRRLCRDDVPDDGILLRGAGGNSGRINHH
jgi:hypothetical protein